MVILLMMVISSVAITIFI